MIGLINALDKVYEALSKTEETKRTVVVDGRKYDIVYTDCCYADVYKDGKLVGHAEVETLRTFGVF